MDASNTKVQPRTFFTKFFLTKKNISLFILSVVSLLTLGSTLASSASMSPMLTHAMTGHAKVPHPATPITLSATEQNAHMTLAVATQYMDAFLIHDYVTMWSLLHPTIQAKWPNQAAFSTFWQKRFQNYILQSYTLGSVQSLSYWIDTETLRQYNNLEKLTVSLHIRANYPQTLFALLPPENLHPETLYQNMPFIVQPVASGHWTVLVGGPADTEAPLLPPAMPMMSSVNVPILMYHHISDSAPQPNPRLWTVTIENFSQQMDYLQVHGYHSITFNQLFNALYYGGPLPNKPVILTFDDGLEDSYTNAYPILFAHHFSGMFYIVSGKVGWDGQMIWNQLRKMLAHGMQMGAHTIHHVNLASVLLWSPDQAQQELEIPPLVMQKQLGIVIQHFCYPYGEPFYLGHVAQQQDVIKMLAANGYIDATVAVGVYSGITQTSTSPFTLPRVPVFGFESLWSFSTSLPWV